MRSSLPRVIRLLTFWLLVLSALAIWHGRIQRRGGLSLLVITYCFRKLTTVYEINTKNNCNMIAKINL